MQGYETAVWVLIALPVLMGLVAVPFRKKAPLLAIVAVNTVIMTILSLYLVTVLSDNHIAQGGYLKISSESLSEAIGLGTGGVHELILILDMILLVVFVLLGIYIKSVIVTLLGVGQLFPLAYFEFTNPAPIEQAFGFALDYLSLTFVLISSIIGSIIAIYATQYMEDEHKQGPFFFFILTFLGVMNGAVLANNMIYLYFFWECTTLCCYFLIKHEGDKVSLANARWAAEVTMAGGAALLLGSFMFQYYNGTGTFSLADVLDPSKNAASDILVALPIFFFSLAAFTKSAQMPFQSWLLGAMVAPTPVSALLHSSTMVKLGVYMIIRMAPLIHQFEYLALMIAAVGAFSFVATALLAIQEKSMKRLLAFSTIGNLGLIIMLAAIGTSEAIAAAVILTVFHAVSKALLFLCAGTVQKIFNRKDIEGSEGLFRRAPSMFGAFFIGMMTMFIAPFGVFIAKYTAITQTAFFNPLLITMVAVGSIACEVFYIRWLGRSLALTGKPTEKKIPGLLTGPLWTLAIGAIVLSLFLPMFLAGLIDPIAGHNHLEAALPYFTITNIGVIPTFLIFVGLLFVVAYQSMNTGARKTEPYVGGMYDYKLEFANPYFEKYTPQQGNMMKAELVALMVIVATLVVALKAAGVF